MGRESGPLRAEGYIGGKEKQPIGPIGCLLTRARRVHTLSSARAPHSTARIDNSASPLSLPPPPAGPCAICARIAPCTLSHRQRRRPLSPLSSSPCPPSPVALARQVRDRGCTHLMMHAKCELGALLLPRSARTCPRRFKRSHRPFLLSSSFLLLTSRQARSPRPSQSRAHGDWCV